MSDAESVGQCDFVAGDVESPVELYFIGVDNLGSREESGGEVNGELGFAGASGTHDDDGLAELVAAAAIDGRGGHGVGPPGWFVEE